MRELVPHLQQALRAHEQLSALTRRSGDLADALDLLPHGIIVVGAGLRILDCNTAAEHLLTQGDVLRISAGSPTETQYSDQSWFRGRFKVPGSRGIVHGRNISPPPVKRAKLSTHQRFPSNARCAISMSDDVAALLRADS